MIFCSAILLSLGAMIFSSERQANSLANASARETEAVKEAPPEKLGDLQSAGSAQLDYWASNLTKFDGREFGYITPARNQYTKNTCWAFAAVGAAETNILRKGIDENATRDNLDLDETIAAYTRHTRDGDQDPLLLTTNDTYDYGRWNQGDGGAVSAFSIMTQGYTLLNENSFHPSVDTRLIKSKLQPSKYYVQSYQSIPYEKDAIKRAVLQYGAVAFNYSAPSTKKYFSRSDPANHTSIIVGWDDNIRRSEFTPQQPDGDGAWIIKNSWGDSGENTVNGTWCYYISYELPIGALYSVDLAMREDYQNIYYYDGNVTISMNKKAGEAQAAVYEAKLSSPTKQEQLKAVMISVPQENLNVHVKIYKNLKVNPGNVNDRINRPDQNAPAAEIDTYLARSGMHTIDLENPIDLEQGEYFSVVVNCRTSSGAPVAVNCAVDGSASVNDMTYYLQDGEWVSFKNSNFYADSSTDNRTAKIRAITNTVDRTTDSDNDLQYARVEIANRLVYYAKDKPLIPEVQVFLDGKLLEAGQDYRIQVQEIVSPGMTTVKIAGTGNYKGVRTTSFEVAKAKNPPGMMSGTVAADSGMAYLRDIPTPDGWKWVNENQKLEYGMNPVSLIYVGKDKDFYQNTTCDFFVEQLNQMPPSDIDISSAEVEIVGRYVYTGEPIVPRVRVTYESAELHDGIDYTLALENNIDAGTATVTVTGNGRYCNRVRQTFVIQKAERPSADTTIHCNKKVTKLSEISPPEGFVWKDDMDITGNRMTATAVYIGKDARNYETTELTFEIILEGQDHAQEEEQPEQGGEQQEQEEEQPEQGEEQPEQEQPIPTNDSEKGWIWAVVIPVAVLSVAGAGIAIAVCRRKKH